MSSRDELWPPRDVPLNFDCREAFPILGQVLDCPTHQQRATCWAHATGCAYLCAAQLQRHCAPSDLPEIRRQCDPNRLAPLCGDAETCLGSGCDPAIALECLTGKPPTRIGQGLSNLQRVHEICRWIYEKGPVVSASFAVRNDFTGGRRGPYDTQQRPGPNLGRHALVIIGWKKTPHGEIRGWSRTAGDTLT
ncbi:unnamed protein product [Vitrella brassicaformis CCMP3155]|uniref:Peptidase C1A papain C-terminal domain-containing protein n=1 Tax=Vitrella brassicaformis (strain CCMP3155) TaxID=1169540 RepID=A0A0G4FV51_VITBC|nr:unnamed protein product [Vitrella brassicaformis CCMP3155]|eukprot:CEM18889.1 unnamed protein product [Vitrella brassicaformis CCMP3155]